MSAVGTFVPPGVPLEKHKLFPPFLNAGSTGAAVLTLQVFIAGRVIGRGGGECPPLSGVYCEQTVRAVKDVQRELSFTDPNLGIDGYWGPATRAAAKLQWGIDFDAIEGDDGTTHYTSPEGDGVWPPAV